MNTRPFLKWAGGKERLLPAIADLLPSRFGKYYEPFVGGGALFFRLASIGKIRDARSIYGRAVLGDVNRALVRTYRAVQTDPDGLMRMLELFKDALAKSRHRNTFYEQHREWFNADVGSELEQAARFILLNKLSFNGLWRVNSDGKFNTPMGEYASVELYSESNLRACHDALQGVEIVHRHFRDTVTEPRENDLVYFDPPYIPLSSTANFASYAADGFGAADHVELRDLALALKAKGVHVVLSNNDTPVVRELYATGFVLRNASLHRGIGADASKRGCVSELLIA